MNQLIGKWNGLGTRGKLVAVLVAVGSGLMGLGLLAVILGLLVMGGKKAEAQARERAATVEMREPIRAATSHEKATQVKEQVKERLAVSELPQRQANDQLSLVDSWLLDQNYQDNPVIADNNYKDKEILIAGPLKKITHTSALLATLGVTSLRGTTNGDRSVICKFRDPQELAQLAGNRPFIIRGTCKGLSDGNVLLENCELIPVDGSWKQKLAKLPSLR